MVNNTSIGDVGGHSVLLNLASRSSLSGGENWTQNTISLKADNITFNTSKDVLALPLPLSGWATGESTKVALDFGVATKNISLSGIITEQNILKKFKDSEDTYNRFMTAHEVSQLIHSYVDSSFLQHQQNLNSIIILMPSRVNKDWQYYGKCQISGVDAPEYKTQAACEAATPTAGIWVADDTGSITDVNTLTENAPLIPFSYKVRGGGSSGSGITSRSTTFDAAPLQLGNFPVPITTTDESENLEGFIRNFSTTMVGGQPYLDFTMDFEIAKSPLG